MTAALSQPVCGRQGESRSCHARRRGQLARAALFVAATGLAPNALAAGSEFVLPCLQADTQAHAACLDAGGLRSLALATRRRTSLQPALATPSVRAGDAALYAQPLLVWQGTGATAPLAATDAAALGRWLAVGGMLLVDPAEPAGRAGRAAFLRGVEETLTRALGPHELAAIPAGHVLYRSFYLLAGIGGARPLADGIAFGGRMAVVVSGEPWLAALATDATSAFVHPAFGDANEREQRLRAAINWLMYALCLDYKDDQVHLPYLLERRGR